LSFHRRIWGRLINLYIALTVVSWVIYARIVRVRDDGDPSRELSSGCRELGYGNLRHTCCAMVLPNVRSPAFGFSA